MEFILQLLADLFIPIEEEKTTAIVKEEDSTEVGAMLATEETEESNIFNFVEFH